MTNQEADSTLAAAAELFLNFLGTRRGEAQRDVSKFLRWFGQDRSLKSLMPPDLESYAAAATTSVVGGDVHIRVVREFLTFARKKGLVSANLGTHLKVRRVTRRRGPPPRRASPDAPLRLTAEGRQEMEQQLVWLREESVRNSAEIKKAAADKDVRENAPLETARQRHGELASRILEIEDNLEQAQLLQAIEADGGMRQVRLGSRVTLQNLSSGDELTYQLVDAREANPLNGKLSVSSPVGQAVLDRWQGQEVEVAAPKGTVHLHIIKVE